MKRALSYFFGFGVLVFFYIALKHSGVIGRQFSDGENIRKGFTLVQSGQQFQFPLEAHPRGIFRYNAYLVFKDEKLAPVNAFQTAELTFTEQLCDGERVLGQNNLKIKVEPNSVSYSGIGRYGALIKTPISQRRKRVCLTVYVDKLSDPILDDLNLSIFVSNTRPCWGIECMLD